MSVKRVRVSDSKMFDLSWIDWMLSELDPNLVGCIGMNEMYD
jgi:hypothetical protein